MTIQRPQSCCSECGKRRLSSDGWSTATSTPSETSSLKGSRSSPDKRPLDTPVIHRLDIVGDLTTADIRLKNSSFNNIKKTATTFSNSGKIEHTFTANLPEAGGHASIRFYTVMGFDLYIEISTWHAIPPYATAEKDENGRRMDVPVAKYECYMLNNNPEDGQPPKGWKLSVEGKWILEKDESRDDRISFLLPGGDGLYEISI